MKVKKYTAPTMPEAMEKVRKELGRTAVILNSKEAKTKGFLGLFRKRYIEIIAAVDPNPIQYRKEQTIKTQLPKQRTKKSHDDKTSHLENELLKEIAALKTELSNKNTNQDYLPDSVRKVINRLVNQQLNERVINELTPKLLESYYRNNDDEVELLNVVKQYFHEKLKHVDSTFNHDFSNAKRIILVGPTGVGKTTTIAKLAAKSAITDGKKVAFITLDTFRIAAIEQLKTYAKILNIPIEVAYNKEDYEKALEKFKDFDLIYVDTAGRNYRKSEHVNQLKDLIELKNEDEVFYVLSLTSKEQDLIEILNRFDDLPIKKVIFTKADETTQFGHIYNLWERYRFNLSYITFGQNVPDDIQRLTPMLTVDLLVGEEKW